MGMGEQTGGQRALEELGKLLQNKRTRNKPEAWKMFFLSDSFLREQRQEEFGRELLEYLRVGEPRTLEEIAWQECIPKSFLIELVIAYGLLPGENGYLSQGEDFFVREAVKRIWNQELERWRYHMRLDNIRTLFRPENLVRLRSFADYLTLCSLRDQGRLTENKSTLRLLAGGKSSCLYEQDSQRVLLSETRSECLIPLLSHWLEQGNVPEEICRYMYQEYGLKDMEHSSNRQLYQRLRQGILQQYPHMERELYGEKGMEQLRKSWKKKLTRVLSAYHSAYDKRIYEESEKLKEQEQALFQGEDWEKLRDTPELLQVLHEELANRRVVPITLVRRVSAMYEHRAGEVKVQELLEGLGKARSFGRQLLETDYTRDYVYRKTTVEEIDGDNREFWEYFFSVSFGEQPVPERETYLDEMTGEWCEIPFAPEDFVPAYIQEFYLPSMEWRKRFTGFDEELEEIPSPVHVEIPLCKGQSLQAEFHLHYIRWFLNQDPVDGPVFSLWDLQGLTRELTPSWQFFYLLAVTGLREEEQEEAGKLILEHLRELPLDPVSLPVLAQAITRERIAWSRWCEQRNPQESPRTFLRVQRKNTNQGTDVRANQQIYYEEQERFCFRAQVSKEGVSIFRKTVWGWEEWELLEGEEELAEELTREGKQRFALEKLRCLRQPGPVKIASYSLSGMESEEKASQILGACRWQETVRGKGKGIPYLQSFPWGPEDLSGPVADLRISRRGIPRAAEDFFKQEGLFMTDSYVVLHMGEQPGKRFDRVFYASTNFFSFDLHFQSPDALGTYNSRVGALKKKIREPHLVAGRFGWGRPYEARHIFAPMPFAVGESGAFYAYDFLRLYRADSLAGLLAELYDLSWVSRADIFEGRLTVSRFDKSLEYCYTDADYERYLDSGTETLPEQFTEFGI